MKISWFPFIPSSVRQLVSDVFAPFRNHKGLLMGSFGPVETHITVIVLAVLPVLTTSGSDVRLKNKVA